jgi:hypothetical protein
VTPKTAEHYRETAEKLSRVSLWLGISYEAHDLLAQPEIHLLLLEGLRTLTAAVIEGTLGDGAVNWVSGGAPPAG